KLTPNRPTVVKSRLLSTSLAGGPEARAAWPVDEEHERGILLGSFGLSVYGHWLVDFLPPLGLLGELEALPDWPVLVSAGAPDWVLPMIAAFDGGRREVIRFRQRPRRKVKVRE